MSREEKIELRRQLALPSDFLYTTGMNKIVFSGIKPSGDLTLGNYLGAIQQWLGMQRTHDSLFCIVDLHAITVPQDPKDLSERTRAIAAWWLAAGLDPEEVTLFVQSDVSAHAELAWILGTQTGMGQLFRMTAFKDKVQKMYGEQGLQHLVNPVEKKTNRQPVGFGLFAYPVLMAADILLYQTNLVPVGEDQKQHVELTRDIAERFNTTFGQTFTMPEPMIQKGGARIISLQDPKSKMSKSDAPNSFIALMDDPEEVKRKIKKAVTDSGSEVVWAEDKPALQNLLTIYSLLAQKTVPEVVRLYQGKGYGDFKAGLTDVVLEFLVPLQVNYKKWRKDEKKLEMILEQGGMQAAERAERTLDDVKEKIGLG